MASRSKHKTATKFLRGLFTKGEKEIISDGTKSDITIPSTSSTPANDPPAVAIHSASSSTLPTITVRDSNELSPDQVGQSPMTTPGGILNNASNIVMQNPSMVDQSTTVNNYHQQSADAARAMERLFNHILPGAAHNSSARDPPPRCHPGTRIAINERIVNWFKSTEKKEWLLWINGLAGVGKSAIVQTFAEKLASTQHLGASVFISRLRQCNDSRRIFLTIAYQLAEHIDAYHAFITSKLARDPELVNKGMKEQFKVFIVEPFLEKKIGAGGNTWAILLDGLDELDTRQGQQEVIRLITSFVLEHPHLPLVWVIASRPEPHISAIFKQETISPSYFEEAIPVESDETYKEIERYLNSSFETIRNNFPEIVPGDDWPSHWDVWRLTLATSGLFAFAELAIRFVGDMDYANPVARLKNVLLAVNHTKASAFEDWPFAYLDALYTRILESISPSMWPTTKRLFSVLLFLQVSIFGRFGIGSLWDISVLLGVELGTIYASFNSCTSVLKIPPRGEASERLVTFYHASFADYLLDSTRSGRFHISSQDAKVEVYSSFIQIWQRFQAQFPPGLDSEYQRRWHQFFDKYTSGLVKNYPRVDLLSQIVKVLNHVLIVTHTKKEGYFESDMDRDRCFDLLGQLDSSTLCQGSYLNTIRFVDWVFDIWTEFREELTNRGTIHEIPFKQLRLEHLDWAILYPLNTYVKPDVQVDVRGDHKYWQESRSREGDVSDIKDFQQRCPQLPVLICGCPGKRFALLKDPKPSRGIQEGPYFEGSFCYEDTLRYYIIPYPDPPDVQQLLRARFTAIRDNFSQIIPMNWPTEAEFRKLADAASGRFVFAVVAIRFIENHQHASPVSRLGEILSIVDGHQDLPVGDETSHLDALYTHVLTSIPSTEWPIMKRVLGALLCFKRGSLSLNFISLQKLCEILGLDEDLVHTSLHSYCFGMVLHGESSASYETVNFYHASFVDYLTDLTRSKDFHISVESATKDVLSSIFRENSSLNQECAKLPIDFSGIYDPELSTYVPDAMLDLLINNHDPGQQGGPFVSEEDRGRCFEVLGQLSAGIVCTEFFRPRHFRRFFAWVFDIWKMFREELAEKGIIREVEFAQLRFDHLDKEVHLRCCTCTRYTMGVEYKQGFELVSGLEPYQQGCPQLPVLICGSSGNRFALFEYQYTDADLTAWPSYTQPPASGLYIIPYPDETLPENN